jgi:hypothetical protein
MCSGSTVSICGFCANFVTFLIIIISENLVVNFRENLEHRVIHKIIK